MFHDNTLMTAAIRAAFSEEVAALGGTVTEVFDLGTRLFARSILPGTREVLPKDKMQPGVALRDARGDLGSSLCLPPDLQQWRHLGPRRAVAAD